MKGIQQNLVLQVLSSMANNNNIFLHVLVGIAEYKLVWQV